MPLMSRFVFQLPGVKFERRWVLGPVTFRPAGALLAEVETLPDFMSQVKNYGLVLDHVRKMAGEWAADATLEVDADDELGAVELARQGVAILRLFMRPEVAVNVDLHKIGLVTDAVLAIREVIQIDPWQRVGFGGVRVDGRVPFTFVRAVLDKWDADPCLQFLSAELAHLPQSRSRLARRALTAIATLDSGFMAIEPTVKVLLYAVAVEVMLSREPAAAPAGQREESLLDIARRVAYLTCHAGCGRSAPSCPYIQGFGRAKALVDLARRMSWNGEEWRCSAFLEIARPPDLDVALRRPSLFGARHEVAHQGITTASDSEIRWLRHTADWVIFAALGWFAAHPTASIADLDAEIDAAATRSAPPAIT
jgi:hypothetical protein